MCMPWEYAIEPCLLDGVGLLPWEWDHFKQQHLGFTDPGEFASDMHTLHALHADSDNGLQSLPDGFNMTQHIVEVTVNDALKEGAALQDKAVVMLDTLMHVNIESASHNHQASFDQLQQKCRVLNTTQILTKFDDTNWVLLEGRQPRLGTNLHVAIHLRSGNLHRRAHAKPVGAVINKHI